MKVERLQGINPFKKNAGDREQMDMNKARNKTGRFKDIITSTRANETLKMGKTEEWIESLEVLRERLRGETTNENLRRYKDSLKKFLEYYTENELYLDNIEVREGPFYTKKISIIKTDDDNKNVLTEDLNSDVSCK